MDNKITLTWQLQSTHITATEICLTLSKVNWLIRHGKICLFYFFLLHLLLFLVLTFDILLSDLLCFWSCFTAHPHLHSESKLKMPFRSFQKSVRKIPRDKHFHPLIRRSTKEIECDFHGLFLNFPHLLFWTRSAIGESRGSVNRMRTYVRRSSFIIQSDIGVGL